MSPQKLVIILGRTDLKAQQDNRHWDGCTESAQAPFCWCMEPDVGDTPSTGAPPETDLSSFWQPKIRGFLSHGNQLCLCN